jgi:hypothetical protein
MNYFFGHQVVICPFCFIEICESRSTKLFGCARDPNKGDESHQITTWSTRIYVRLGLESQKEL